MSDKKPNNYVKKIANQIGIYLQPDPKPNTTASMHDLVAADLGTRKQFGIAKYGTTLQAGNGRDALRDAYDEVLDLAVYLRQAIEERDNPPTFGTRIHEMAEAFNETNDDNS